MMISVKITGERDNCDEGCVKYCSENEQRFCRRWAQPRSQGEETILTRVAFNYGSDQELKYGRGKPRSKSQAK